MDFDSFNDLLRGIISLAHANDSLTIDDIAVIMECGCGDKINPDEYHSKYHE